MRRILLGTISQRRLRSLSIVLAIIVATFGSLLLTTGIQRSEAQIVGAIDDNARSAYDILVRPGGSSLGLEGGGDLVEENYLSGLFGGITLEDYEAVRQVSGVEVAAPVANLGYTNIVGTAFVDLSRTVTSLPALVRVDPTYTAANGLAKYPDAPIYVYLTSEPFDEAGPAGVTTVQVRNGVSHWPCWSFNVDPAGEGIAPARPFYVEGSAGVPASSAFDTDARTALQCYSKAGPSNRIGEALGRPDDFIGVSIPVSFPVLISAIDPEEEDALVGLHAATQGEYLSSGQEPNVTSANGVKEAVVPFLLSGDAFSNVDLDLSVNVLDTGAEILDHLDATNARQWATGLPGEELGAQSVDLGPVFKGITDSFGLVFDMSADGSFFSPYIGNMWTVGGTVYEQAGDRRAALVMPDPSPETWASSRIGSEFDLVVPVDNLATQVRPVARVPGKPACAAECIWSSGDIVGTFDPDQINGFSGLSRVPLETYRAPSAEAADDGSRGLLGDQPLTPDRNLGGYLRQPPALLTTIESIDEIMAGRDGDLPQRDAPISAIRIRVAGVTGIDGVSRARVSAVVEEIQRLLGDSVDVEATLGSSPAPQEIALPPGLAGADALVVQEYWAQKGASLQIVGALNSKTLALLVLVPALAGVFVCQSAFASMRSRRVELGTLSALGWTRGSLLAFVGAELILLALAGGVIGALGAWLAGKWLSLDLPAERVLVAVPAALVLAAAAGAMPVWRAAQARPLSALRPPVAPARRSGRTRSVSQMALNNVYRVFGRSAVSGVGFAASIAALTILLAVSVAFSGKVSGTLMGGFVVAEVEPLDFVAVCIAVILGIATLVDSIVANQIERMSELATLSAVGWSRAAIARLAAFEGMYIAAASGLLGAALGATVCAILSADLLSAANLSGIFGGTVAAILGGLIAAGVALIVPASKLASVPPATLFKEGFNVGNQ